MEASTGRLKPFAICLIAASVCLAETTEITTTPTEVDSTSLDSQADAPARVRKGNGVLPNDAGQIWREYDIRPYVQSTQDENPEQAIVDWILRETGTDIWFREPLGLLNANRESIRVYHVPEVQRVVANIVQRFVRSDAGAYSMSIRLVTVRSPGWRALALRTLKPLDVQTPGVEAWLISKENAAILLSQLRLRADFREHNSPYLLVRNGQSHTITRYRPRSYPCSVVIDELGNFQVRMGSINQGYALRISPLMSIQNDLVDAVIKCEVDQIESFTSVWIDTPTIQSPRHQTEIQVPKVSSWRLHDRFRWRPDQVLLVSRGLAASPEMDKSSALSKLIPNNPPRADALLFLECKRSARSPSSRTVSGEIRTSRLNSRGRY